MYIHVLTKQVTKAVIFLKRNDFIFIREKRLLQTSALHKINATVIQINNQSCQ